jgi:hypothetical protein
MQGRANIGQASINLGGRRAVKLSGASGQPVAAAQRHQPASAGPRRTGSVEIANVDSTGLVTAGKVTGSPPEPVQQVKPVLNNANSV